MNLLITSVVWLLLVIHSGLALPTRPVMPAKGSAPSDPLADLKENLKRSDESLQRHVEQLDREILAREQRVKQLKAEQKFKEAELCEFYLDLLREERMTFKKHLERPKLSEEELEKLKEKLLKEAREQRQQEPKRP